MIRRKLITKVMCFTMVCSMILPMQSVSANAAGVAESYDVEPSSEEISSFADFEAVDELIEQRVDALTEGDMNEYRELSEELEEYGCEDISAQEVQRLTGETPKDLLNSQIQSRNSTSASIRGLYSASSSNVQFSKSVTNVTYGGKKYKVMKITASPTGRGTLFSTGSVTQRYKTPVAAGSLSLLKVVISEAASKSKIVQTVSLFDSVGSALKDFKRTTKVDDVQANYTWIVEEICSFIYVYDARVKNYAIGASYNKAKYTVAVNIPYIKVKNGKRYSGITQKKYSKWNSAKNYGDTNMAISYFKKGRVYNSHIYNVMLNGNGGKTIKNVYLQHPSTATTLGYWVN